MKNTIQVINYDEEAQEADILISDGQFKLLCYAHPYILGEAIKSDTPHSAFVTENVMKALYNEYKIEKLQSGYYSYHLCGKIIDLENRLVAIGNIVVELENVIPEDIREDEFIEFTVMRIDW